MKKAVIYIFLTALVFSTMEVALKIGGASFDSLQLTFLRFLIGGLVLSPLAIVEYRQNYTSKGERLAAKDLLWVALLGVVCIPVSMLAFQLGVVRCNAASSAALMSLNPIFTMLIAHIFTTEKMSRAKWVSVALGLVACVFLMRPWDVQEGNTALGLALVLFAAISFAAYTVMGKKTLMRVGLFTQTSISFIVGSLVMLVVVLALGRPVLANIAGNWIGLAYISIVTTGLGYFAYFMAIKLSDASTAALAFYIKPMLAPIFAVLILHETILWNTIAGIILMLIASFITVRDRAKEKRNVGK